MVFAPSNIDGPIPQVVRMQEIRSYRTTGRTERIFLLLISGTNQVKHKTRAFHPGIEAVGELGVISVILTTVAEMHHGGERNGTSPVSYPGGKGCKGQESIYNLLQRSEERKVGRGYNFDIL